MQWEILPTLLSKIQRRMRNPPETCVKCSLVSPSFESVPIAAKDERYDGGQDSSATKVKSKDVAGKAGGCPRAEGSNCSEVQEELDMLQLNESHPYVSIEYIKKAIKAQREEDSSALEADRCRSG